MLYEAATSAQQSRPSSRTTRPALLRSAGLVGWCSCLHRTYGDRLPGGVEVEGGGALLAAADAGLLVAPERHLELKSRRRHVDVREAGLGAGYELVGVAQGTGGYPGGQAEAGVVGELHGVVEVPGLYDDQHRAEDLLLRRLGGVVHVGDDCRR